MARPYAIYASIPPTDSNGPIWDTISGKIPVVYSRPNSSWPNLDWVGNIVDNSSPTQYKSEHPSYLWADPIVKNPEMEESYVFIRQWNVGPADSHFTSQVIPSQNLIFVLSHAADNQYTTALITGSTEQTNSAFHPLGSNSDRSPSNDGWRNVKTFLYHIDLTKVAVGTKINLISEVINNGQKGSTDNSNPAMFTWILQIFGFPPQ